MTPGSAGRWGVGRSKRKERVDAEVRAALAEFAAAVEVRVHAELERSRQTQVALIDAVRGLQAELDNRDQALAHALERIGQAIDHSSETIDARARRTPRAGRDGRQAHAGVAAARADDRRDRRRGSSRASTSSAARSSARPTRSSPPTSTSSPRNAATRRRGRGRRPNDINGTATRPTDHVEVQCRIEGQWIDGFEVFEIIQDGGLRRYRLRRLSDGVVMPVQYAGTRRPAQDRRHGTAHLQRAARGRAADAATGRGGA